MEALESFYNNLSQDIISLADEEGIYKEEAFFETVTDDLVEEGILPEAQYTYFKPETGGIRVDGYCGDPLDRAEVQGVDEGELGLIVLDFNPTNEIVTLTKTEMEADFRRLEKFVSRSLKSKFRDSLEPSDPAFGLADLINTRWQKTSRVKLYLISNKKLSIRVDGMDAGELEGKPIAYDVWDITRYQGLVAQGEERESLLIDFNELPGGPLHALKASAPKDKNQVYLAAIPGRDLAAIYDRWGTRLLEQNVRVFLQARSNVNKGIKRTLENEPEMFFSYNNGITATAESVTTEERNGGLVITGLENFQIVNGGQTTASIYAAYKNKKNLNKVFVQMKLCVVKPKDAQELVPRISEYANSQNKVSSADFFANHPYHVRIEEFSRRIWAPAKEGSFKQTKWFYERARGSYNNEQAYLTSAKKKAFQAEYPRSQMFNKTDLAKYLMVWTDKPYFVNRGAQKNFAEFAKDISTAWDKNEAQFSEYYFKTLVAKKIIYNATEKIVQSRDWYEAGGYRAQHVALAIGKLSNVTSSLGKTVDFGAIWNKQCISPELEAALGQAADAAHGVLMNPGEGYRNISEWAKQLKCWDALKRVEVDWDEDWNDSLIDLAEEKDIERKGAADQRELNGLQAQIMVENAGYLFWGKVLKWCKAEGEGSEKERNILKIAANRTKLPSDKQSVVLVNMMERLEKEGCPYHLG